MGLPESQRPQGQLSDTSGDPLRGAEIVRLDEEYNIQCVRLRLLTTNALTAAYAQTTVGPDEAYAIAKSARLHFRNVRFWH
jgi:hypothetical protein